MQDEPGGRGCFAYKMSLKRGSVMLGIDDQSEQCDRDQPPVGRPCGIAERSGIKAKPSMKGKTKTIPARGAVSLPLVGPETVAHESLFKERRPAYPIPVPQAHSWMRKCCPDPILSGSDFSDTGDTALAYP